MGMVVLHLTDGPVYQGDVNKSGGHEGLRSFGPKKAANYRLPMIALTEL